MQHFPQVNQFLKDSSFFYTIVIGMDSHYSYVSKNYDRNFEFTNTTLLGKHFSTTLHPDDIEICEEAGMASFSLPGQLVPVTLRKHNGHGGYVTTQWEMQALLNENGQPDGIFCIGYNITEFVDTRNQLDTAQNHLNEIGFMQSHLIRKPLANILGLTEMIRQETADERLTPICEMLTNSANELDYVLKRISDKADD
jgi:nitrogen-specific signal transduction histidine kinase